jgi:hypothetical protein
MSHPSKLQSTWIDAMADRLRTLGIRCSKERPLVTGGHVEITVGALSPVRRHLDDGEIRPRLDSDACLFPVRDLLEKAGVLADDVLIRTNVASSGVGPLSLRVRLVRCDGPDWSLLPEPAP